jgi:hypothetical protein
MWESFYVMIPSEKKVNRHSSACVSMQVNTLAKVNKRVSKQID